jgi:pyruvate dehydrogenase E1 component beta subunit
MLYMSGGQFKIPIVFRGPGGSAYQVSSQHSQAIESWFAYFPGLKVVMPSTPADAKGLLKSAIRDDDPVIFIEQERMYGMKGEVPEKRTSRFHWACADVKREGTDATIVARSLMVPTALKAAERLEKDGMSCEVIDPRTIRRWTSTRSLSRKENESRGDRRRVACVSAVWAPRLAPRFTSAL